MSNSWPFPSNLARSGGCYAHPLRQPRSYLNSGSDLSDSTDDEEESNSQAPRFHIAFGQRQSRSRRYSSATATHNNDNTVLANSLQGSDGRPFSHQVNPFRAASPPTNSSCLIRSLVSPGRLNARNNTTVDRETDGFGLGASPRRSDYNTAPSSVNSQDRGMITLSNGFDATATSSVSRPQGLPLDTVAANNCVCSPPHRSRGNSRRRVSMGSENRISRLGSQGGSTPHFVSSILSYNSSYEPDTNAAETYQYNDTYSHDPSVEFSTENLQEPGDTDASSSAPSLSSGISNSTNTQPKPSANSVIPNENRRPPSDIRSSFTPTRLAALPPPLPEHDGSAVRAPSSHHYPPWLDVHSGSDDDLGTDGYRLLGCFSGSASDDIVIDNLTARRSLENSDCKRNIRFKLNQTTDNAMKRPRDKSGSTIAKSTDIMEPLAKKGAVSIFLYHSGIPNLEATDVWPDIRDGSKVPAQYFRLSQEASALVVPPGKVNGCSSREPLRPTGILKLKRSLSQQGKRNRGWPAGTVPTEMFEEIASYLSRDDIKSMRLVCREFDQHVSQVLFNTVVVPFNTEIYGMLGTEKKQDIKGKGKMKVNANKGLSWKNANGDDVYNGHGLDVFRGFGPHILRYGMSFDVDEDALARPPYKGTTEGHTSFWGTYDWPFEEYRRFDDVAGLEFAADETPKMKIAFSMLRKVQELALSIDSGLGWLKGPDRSIRARILRQSPQVFGRSKDIPDRKTQAQKELWDYVEATHYAADMDVKLATLYRMDVSRPFSELQPTLDSRILIDSQCGFPFMDPHLIAEAMPDDIPDAQIPSLEEVDSLEAFVEPQTPPTTGIIYSATSSPSDAAQLQSPIIPARLTKAQKEWLLETEWAQRAFLSSYILAVIDNPIAFEKVHTLNIARVSSRYTFSLCRQDFWDALPQLKTVIIQVIPDWRNVLKDEAGFVETPRIDPSYAIGPFHQLLNEIVSPRANIKNLTFGWAAGGEHAEGVHARNKHILPAPILPDDATLILYSGQLSLPILYLPHVENLTLKNCWITPAALQALVKKHEKTKLQKLTLESVSLTAVPRMVANQNQNPNHNLNLNANLPQAAVAGQQAHPLGNPQNHMGIPPAIQQGHGNLQPQQLLALQIQALQIQIQQLQLQTQQNAHAQAQVNALQVQLQAQLQLQAHLQAHGVAMGIPPPPPPPPPPPQQFTVVSAVCAKHREGSWPYVIDIISPGQNLSHFGSAYSNAEPGRITNLRQLKFVSCGYVRLPHSTIDQAALEPANPMIRLPHFTKRYNALVPAMLSSKDPLLGEIIQEVEPMELSALFTAWSLNQGWSDLFERQGSEFDGLLPGGTGRFSGII